MAVSTPRPMPTPYAGVVTDPTTGEKYAPKTGPMVLVTCPSGGGKTESVLAPACISFPGSVCLISSKDDILRLVMERRMGPVYLIDLRQMPTPNYGHDVTQCRIDPTVLIASHDHALNMATWLHRASTLSLGGRVTSHADPYWTYQIVPALAALLYTASPLGNKRGIDWVLNACENPFKPKKPESIKVPAVTEADKLKVDLAKAKLAKIEADPTSDEFARIAARLQAEDAQQTYDDLVAAAAEAKRIVAARRAEAAARKNQPQPLSEASWWDCRQYLPEGSLLARRIERTAELNERQRDSVALGMSAALFPWVYEATRRPTLPIFEPGWLDDPTATVCILAEPEGGGVGAALPLIQSIVAAWRRKTAEDTVTHNVLLAIDELTNTLPLPSLDIAVSESRGLGINIIAAVQAAQQIANRYDPIFCDTLLKLFPVVLVMHGSAELDVLDQASLWSGLTTRAHETIDQATGNRVLSVEEGPLMLPQELQPTEKFTGRLVYRGTPGVKVELPSFTEFLALFDSRAIRGMVRI